MQQLTPAILQKLLNTPSQCCVSIYLPTMTKGDQQRQNVIRFKNLIGQARDELAQSNLVNHQVKESLSRAEEYLNQPEYWQHQKRGLAVLVDETDQYFFRLPLKFSELVFVGNRFYLKPLMPLITTNGKFFILTLSQNDIKLYQATRTDIDKVYLGDIPRSLEEYSKGYEYHTSVSSHSSSSGASAPIFHGQGKGEEDTKKEIEDFLNQVENGVTTLLEGQNAPLVLAGVEFLTSMYGKLNKYTDLVETSIEGAPNQTTKEALHKEAWKLVRPVFKEREKQALESYHNEAGTGKTSCDLTEVVTAAHDGRIDNLFVTRDLAQWGEYDPTKRTISTHKDKVPHSQDLYDLAAFQTLVNSGRVYSMKPEEMVKGCQIAAVFRY